MEIIVCIKQVPDIAEIAKVKTDPETGTDSHPNACQGMHNSTTHQFSAVLK